MKAKRFDEEKYCRTEADFYRCSAPTFFHCIRAP